MTLVISYVWDLPAMTLLFTITYSDFQVVFILTLFTIIYSDFQVVFILTLFSICTCH